MDTLNYFFYRKVANYILFMKYVLPLLKVNKNYSSTGTQPYYYLREQEEYE